jgi:uncharacterized protein (TIGR03435 family)
MDSPSFIRPDSSQPFSRSSVQWLMRPLLLVLCPILAGIPALSQTGNSSITFEAATIKPFPEGANIQFSGCMGGPGSDDPGRFDCQYVSLNMLLSKAYQVKTMEVFGPSWLDTAHFNVEAKLPRGATRDQVPAMFRNLVAERFKVELHHETRPLPGYSLTVAKSGLKIKESAPPSENPADDGPPPGGKLPIDDEGFPILRPSVIAAGPNILYRGGRARLQAGNTTIARLAESLSQQMNQVVVDETGLTGKYDMKMTWVPDSAEISGRPRGAAVDSDLGVDLMTALERQLGLKLVSKKVPRDTIVVDRAEKPQN